MTRNKHSRVTKLEDQAGIKGERHKVIPHCCFYGKNDRDCDCVPYWTYEPRVIGEGMGGFYKEIEAGCQIPPEDAELILDYYDEKETV